MFCLLLYVTLVTVPISLSSCWIFLWSCDFWNRSVPHRKQKKRKTAVFLSYCHVAPCHATKEGKWKGKKIAIQVAELFFSLLLRRKYRRKSYYYRKDEWFIKKLVINTRQPVTSVLHILHSWSVNKIGRANYSKSMIHIDSRNISWSKQSWWKVFVP